MSNRTIFVRLIVTGYMLFTIIHASAQMNPSIANGDFSITPSDPSIINSIGFWELPNGYNNTNGYQDPSFAWQVGGNGVDVIGGSNSVWSGYPEPSVDLNASDVGSISQNVSNLIKGNWYVISFDLSGNPATGSSTKTLNVSLGDSSKGFSFFVPPGMTNSTMTWEHKSFTTYYDGQSNLLSFTSTTQNSEEPLNSPCGPVVDNINVAITPEAPSSLLLLFGLVPMSFVLYKRRMS